MYARFPYTLCKRNATTVPLLLCKEGQQDKNQENSNSDLFGKKNLDPPSSLVEPWFPGSGRRCLYQKFPQKGRITNPVS